MRRALPLFLLSPLATAAADEPAPPPPEAQVAIAEPAPAPDAAPTPLAAVAGPGAIAPVAPPAVETPTAAAPTGLERRRRDDAASGRSYFAETALTTPRGRVAVDLRAPTLPIVGLGLRVGVTDRLEVGATTVVVADEGSLVGLSIKGQLWRGQRAAIAAGLNTYTAEGDTLYDAHLEGTTCLDRDCVTAGTLSLNFLAFTDEDTVPVLGGIGFSAGREVQFIGEVHQTREDDEAVTVGYVGLRAARAGLSIDGGVGFAFATSGCTDCDGDDGGALPFLGVSGRM